MAESMANPARREAVLWALGHLESLMGTDWLERYFDKTGHVPEGMNLGAGHVAATGHLLDMALRAAVRSRRSRSTDGIHRGAGSRGPAPVGPTDVSVRRDGQELRVETFAVLHDQRS
ncbi:MAG: hypothetical protein ACRDNF_10775 [Streptosporangiaceae bacterium]